MQNRTHIDDDDDLPPWDDDAPRPKQQTKQPPPALPITREWSFARLESGAWGASTFVRPDAEDDDYQPSPGEKIVIIKRDGSTRSAAIGRVDDIREYESGARRYKVTLK